MKHSFLDQYAYQDTPVHRLDARVKILVFGALILATATTPAAAWWALAGYGAVLCCLIGVARIPPLYVLTRWLMILPFVLVAAASAPFLEGGRALWSGSVLGLRLSVSEGGLSVALNAIVRATFSVVALITFVSVTPMESLLDGLRRLRLPAVLVVLTGFAYRYLFLLVDEAHRLKTARDSRSFGGGPLAHMRSLGRMIASLLVRSCERAERGYDAGAPPPSRKKALAARDVAFLATGLLVVLALRSSTLWIPLLQ